LAGRGGRTSHLAVIPAHAGMTIQLSAAAFPLVGVNFANFFSEVWMQGKQGLSRKSVTGFSFPDIAAVLPCAPIV
jgi:hypothetical protein